MLGHPSPCPLPLGVGVATAASVTFLTGKRRNYVPRQLLCLGFVLPALAYAGTSVRCAQRTMRNSDTRRRQARRAIVHRAALSIDEILLSTAFLVEISEPGAEPDGVQRPYPLRRLSGALERHQACISARDYWLYVCTRRTRPRSMPPTTACGSWRHSPMRWSTTSPTGRQHSLDADGRQVPRDALTHRCVHHAALRQLLGHWLEAREKDAGDQGYAEFRARVTRLPLDAAARDGAPRTRRRGVRLVPTNAT